MNKTEGDAMIGELIIKFSIDGNKYCALVGDDLQIGLAGFGDSPLSALSELVDEIIVHGWNIEGFTLYEHTLGQEYKKDIEKEKPQ